MDGVHLYDIDDRSKIASERTRERYREAQLSERIVAEEADAFEVWLDSWKVKPTTVEFRNQVKSVLESELKKSLNGKLKHLGSADPKALAGMMNAAANKLVHHPTMLLKTAASEGSASFLVNALQTLFDLEPCSSSTTLRTSNPPGRPRSSQDAIHRFCDSATSDRAPKSNDPSA